MAEGRGREGTAATGDSAVLAAIDLGTNSFHLLVARVDSAGRFEVVAQEKEMVRLGGGSGDMSHLSDEAMDRGVACLERFRQIAEVHGAELRAVATSAVREADNRDTFAERARTEAGVWIEVIPGIEEARLIHLGVLQALDVYNSRLLMIDIGGGSTELLVGEATTVLAARSLKLGAIRLTDRFFPTGKATTSAFDDCRLHVKAFLQPAVRELRPLGHDKAAGCSGTIEAVARIALGLAGDDTDRSLSAHDLTRDDVGRVVAALAANPRVSQRRKLAGLDSKRVDIIVAGAVLLEQIMDSFAIGAVTLSPYALREGVLLDEARARLSAHGEHLRDVRRDSVLHMANLFNEDIDHIRAATELAVSLFDTLAVRHQLGRAERDLLEAAGLLHNVGLFVSHAAHHKHSYYVIRNSDHLVGFTDNELELIAQIARYHRKSAPKSSHPEFAALSGADQEKVRVLAGILRIAIALDRTHSRAVSRVRIGEEDERLHLVVEPAEGADISLELYTARQRSQLLASALDVPVEVSSTAVSS